MTPLAEGGSQKARGAEKLRALTHKMEAYSPLAMAKPACGSCTGSPLTLTS